jgi:HK97 gp10 family phage protein
MNMPDDAYKALRQKLDTLRHDALVSAERKALREVGNLIRNAVEEVCPVHAGEPEGLLKQGELKDSWRSSIRIASDQGAAAGKEDTVTVQPNTKVCRDVAGWVEHGHAGPNTDTKRTKPHPFIRPTRDAIEQKAIETYYAVMTAEIQRTFHE